MKDFKNIKPGEIEENPFKMIGTEWMLLTAGVIDNYNTMTAAWGGFGFAWNKNVCYVYIRPQRYTFEFAERFDYFTMTFFEEEYRKALKFCGTKSGRDFDKAKETGITPISTEHDNVIFREGHLAIECRKLYYQDITPDNILDESIKADYHRLYVGEVMNVYRKSKKAE